MPCISYFVETESWCLAKFRAFLIKKKRR